MHSNMYTRNMHSKHVHACSFDYRKISGEEAAARPFDYRKISGEEAAARPFEVYHSR